METENNNTNNSKSNSIVMGIVLVVALLIIGSLGAYAVMNKKAIGSMIRNNTAQTYQKTANTPSPTPTPVAKPSTPEIKPVESSKDLDSIQNQLNKTDIEVGSSVNF